MISRRQLMTGVAALAAAAVVPSFGSSMVKLLPNLDLMMTRFPVYGVIAQLTWFDDERQEIMWQDVTDDYLAGLIP